MKNWIRSLSLEELKLRLGYVQENLENLNKRISRIENRAEENHRLYGWARSYPVEYPVMCDRACELEGQIKFIQAEIALR